jgi:hypothetical protein
LITRVGARIQIKVAGPRNGVKHNFITGRNDIIVKQNFWTVIRSQDIMARYKRMGFKNDPSVLLEYVKFLIMNTGMEAINQIEKNHEALESQVKSLTKEVKVADPKATSASNSSDRIKSSVEALTKRVSSLENKK